MDQRIVLASGSAIRATLLRNANVPFAVVVPRIDEESIRAALENEGATPQDVADTLAEVKAQRIAAKHPGCLVIGCDQVLALDRQIFAKAQTPQDARDVLRTLRGKTHKLLSAAVIYEDDRPVWRHVGQVRLFMRDISDAYLEDYLDRNWDQIRHCVGCYQLEGEGVRLFSRIEGDYFNVLGMPLLELLSYLALRGTLAS
jgi:septum formation protein